MTHRRFSNEIGGKDEHFIHNFDFMEYFLSNYEDQSSSISKREHTYSENTNDNGKFITIVLNNVLCKNSSKIINKSDILICADGGANRLYNLYKDIDRLEKTNNINSDQNEIEDKLSNLFNKTIIRDNTKKSHRKHKKHKKLNFQSSSNNDDEFNNHKYALDKIYGSLKNNNSSIDPVINNFYIECDNNNIISTDEYSNYYKHGYYKPPSDIYDNDNYIHNKYQISNIYGNAKDSNNNFNSYIKRKKVSKKTNKFEHSENDCIGFVCDEEYMCEYLHFDENHVESPDRIRCIIKALKEKNIINKMVQIKGREALYDEIKECHTRAHINNIFYSLKKKLKYKKKDVIYPFDKHDTYYTFHTGTVSKRAVGVLLNLCDAILSDKNEKFKYIDFKKSLRYNYNFFKNNFSNDLKKFI
ncbi:histone deacetylase 2, putative (HDA2), partial [Plasmodium ovale curtisi]